MFSRPGLISALVVAACVAWSAPAWAHSAFKAAAEAPAPIAAAPIAAASVPASASPAVLWPAILAAASLIVAWRRPRRALALAIVLILVVFAFETGVHSVHHLNDLRHLEDLRSGLTCHVAAASAHLAGTPVDVTTHESLVLPSYESVVVQTQPDVDARSLSAHQGRAPPLSA